MDLRISVTGGVHFDLVKRVLRDIKRADQEPEEIIQQISETVHLIPINNKLLDLYVTNQCVKVVKVLSISTLCRYIPCIRPLSNRISEQHI